MLYFKTKVETLFVSKIIYLIILLLSFSFYLQAHDSVSVNPNVSVIPRYEYAIFYMETQGEFVVPVTADAPAIYSWSDPKGTIKGDIPEIWRHLNITSEIEYSFTNIESVLLNHVAAQGWVLLDLEITSVPITRSDLDFRTAYRYIFKRVKTEVNTK